MNKPDHRNRRKALLMISWSALISFAAIFFLASCSDDQADPSNLIDQDKIDAQVADFGEANLAFAVDLFQEALNQAEAGANVLVSPLSVHAALQMVLNGADGETYDAIAGVLHSTDFSETTLNESYLNLVQALKDIDDKTEIRMANSVFWDPAGVDPHHNFLDKMSTWFDAHQENLDFRSPEALTAINDWVNDKTEGRIEKILEEIKPEEVMFLINALYFIGDWEKDFPEESTYDRGFTLADGNNMIVPMMHLDEYLNFFIGEDLAAVDLIFGDSSFSMTCIRPIEKTQPIDGFIRGLDRARIEHLWSRDLQRQRVYLGLPKFEVSYEANLTNALKAMGMEVAFDPNRADLGRLGNAFGNLYVSRVKHKTFLTIDESGAEGAAVTAVGVGVTSAPPTLFFDRSFYFVIRDLRFNSILFAGKVENPAQE